MSNRNVVVLAAGLGERFALEGISVPKPLIEFRGRSLLARSVDVALEIRGSGGGRVIVVTTPAVARAASALEGVDYVVEVSVTQPGPVASGMLALAHLPPENPVVFMDCDNYFPSEARSWTQLGFGDSDFMVVGAFPADLSPSDFCNVRIDTSISAPAWMTYMVTEVAEKVPLGDVGVFAGAGVYMFSKVSDFRCTAMRFLHAKQGPKEVPMSQVLAHSTLYSGRKLFAVLAEAWLPIGTPAQIMAAARHSVQSPTSNE